MWLAAFSRGCKTCNLKPKHHLLSESLSQVNLEILKSGQKESKVQGQGISFPCPLFDTIERVVNFSTLHFLTPLGILCCFV